MCPKTNLGNILCGQKKYKNKIKKKNHGVHQKITPRSNNFHIHICKYPWDPTLTSTIYTLLEKRRRF